MEWGFKSGLPIYTQIIDIMTMRIAAGVYEPGEKLPSVRDMAMEAGVNPNTMQRAMSELERQGLLFSERTNGRFVTEDQEILGDLRERLAESYFRDMEEKLENLGLEKAEISDLIRRWLERGHKLQFQVEHLN